MNGQNRQSCRTSAPSPLPPTYRAPRTAPPASRSIRRSTLPPPSRPRSTCRRRPAHRSPSTGPRVRQARWGWRSTAMPHARLRRSATPGRHRYGGAGERQAVGFVHTDDPGLHHLNGPVSMPAGCTLRVGTFIPGVSLPNPILIRRQYGSILGQRAAASRFPTRSGSTMRSNPNLSTRPRRTPSWATSGATLTSSRRFRRMMFRVGDETLVVNDPKERAMRWRRGGRPPRLPAPKSRSRSPRLRPRRNRKASKRRSLLLRKINACGKPIRDEMVASLQWGRRPGNLYYGHCQEFVNSTLRMIGILDSGESPTSTESTNAMVALNQLLANWSAAGIPISRSPATCSR